MLGGVSDPAVTADPANQLEYAQALDERPGALTAMGVLSIIFASLSLLGSLYLALMLIPLAMFAFGTVPTPGPGTGTTPLVAGSLSAADAGVIVAALHGQSPLSQTDQQALQAALTTVEVPLTAPPDGVWTTAHIDGQVSGFSVTNYGTTSWTGYNLNTGGAINVNAGGVTLSYTDAAGAWTTTTYTTGGGTTTNSVNFNNGGPFNVGRGQVVLHGVAAAMSLALAGLLLAAGVQAVRGRPSGRTLHLWWAWPKLLASLLAGAAWFLLFRNIFGGIGGGGPPGSVAWMFGGGAFLLGAAWPVAVLILLRTRKIRAYYAGA